VRLREYNYDTYNVYNILVCNGGASADFELFTRPTELNRFKTNIYIVFPVYVAVFFLLFTGTLAWSDDTTGPTLSAQAEVPSATGEVVGDTEEDAWEEEDDWDEGWGEEDTIADPLEPLNRVFFHFNDKLYYWALKPLARGYAAIFPEDIQITVRNFFDNLRSPTRAVNCLLQGQAKDSSVEVARFALNSTVGILGLVDFAKDVLDLNSTREDTGQTLGFYGAGGGFYINWPFLGPSNFRDSLGLLGDAYLHPFIFFDLDTGVIVGTWTLEKVNYAALTMGDYELFKETALDPYTALKDAYQQHRNGLIKEDRSGFNE
jgi:phospholipid-binding lipoprotein MlaA